MIKQPTTTKKHFFHSICYAIVIYFVCVCVIECACVCALRTSIYNLFEWFNLRAFDTYVIDLNWVYKETSLLQIHASFIFFVQVYLLFHLRCNDVKSVNTKKSDKCDNKLKTKKKRKKIETSSQIAINLDYSKFSLVNYLSSETYNR